MSDEKTLFNKEHNVENEEKQLHSIAVEEDSELVDFSSAFDGEDDTALEEAEVYNGPVFESPLSKVFSLFKRKKDKNEDEKVKEKTEEKVEENSDDSAVDKEENAVIDEKQAVVVEKKQKKGKKRKGSSFAKKEKEPEIPVEEKSEAEEKIAEEPEIETLPSFEESNQKVEKTEQIEEKDEPVEETQEKIEEVVEETVEEDIIETPTEESTEIEIFEIEPEDESEEPKPEKKRAAGFDFLRRKIKDSPVQEEIVEEVVEAEEKTAEEPEIEMLPSFEETEQIEEENEPVEETEVDEIPPVEEVVQEDVADAPSEETAEEIELIPPFEAAVEEKSTEQAETTEVEAETENAEESADEQDEKAAVQLLTTRDHVTFILIILALLLTIAFIVVKFIPLGNNNTQDAGEVVQAKDAVSEIQLQRESAVGHFIQSDIDDVFYVYSADYKPAFYQCNGNKMKSVETAGKLNPIVEMGTEKMSVTVDYIEVDGKLFGTGVFRKTDNLSNIVVFKLVNLPKGYEQDGKALLLATSNSEAVSKRCSIWSDSYVVDLATGKTTRFLSSNNSVYSAGYAVLTDEGYASENGEIPFFSTRDYDATTNKRDIYLKVNGKETRYATDVAGSFVYTDAGVVSYLKVVEEGFNVVRKENGKEKVIFSLGNDTSYLYHNEYLLDKYNGNLYNVKTGEKIVITGYGMTTPEMMTVSSDGRYLVVVGAVNSVIDYQVHIFDLKTGNCAKYVDDNFSQHKNLAFVNNTTIIYSAVEPKQGYEYVMLDVSKAF